MYRYAITCELSAFNMECLPMACMCAYIRLVFHYVCTTHSIFRMNCLLYVPLSPSFNFYLFSFYTITFWIFVCIIFVGLLPSQLVLARATCSLVPLHCLRFTGAHQLLVTFSVAISLFQRKLCRFVTHCNYIKFSILARNL